MRLERALLTLWCDTEVRAFYIVLVGGTLFIAVYLLALGHYTDPLQALRHSAFHVVSVATTGGFATQDYSQ